MHRIYNQLSIKLVCRWLCLGFVLATFMPSVAMAKQPSAECRAVMPQDTHLQAQMRSCFQETDYAMTMRNKKHVVYAYAGIWVLTMWFVVSVWKRNLSLEKTIISLRRAMSEKTSP